MTDLALPDGRNLEFHDAGGDGGVLLFHHGTPGSGLPRRGLARAAAEHGLRLVTYSRAGYARSGRRPGRSVADVADDMSALLDHLDVERCVTAGESGGGPHALATAALLPERVTAVASIAGAAPHDVPGLDFLAGMGEQNVAEFGAALDGEPALRRYLETEVEALSEVDAVGIVEGLSTLLPDVDRAVLTGELGEDLAANIGEGVRRGVDGWLDDDLAFVAPWGFDPADLRVPVSVWQGDLDLMVPFAHGGWLADHLPGAHPHLLAGEGHLSITVGSLDQILDELADHLNA